MTAMKTLVCTILVLLPVALSAASPPQDCVLDASGKTVCTQVMQLDMSGVARNTDRAPCSQRDTVCWCEKVRDYTNQVRAKKGVKKMLKLGTRAQMKNASQYARKLAQMGRLVHQALPKVTREVGCQRWVGGENLAYNYNRGDVARACVDQWIKSPGHFQNLIREWFEEVVTGFHWDDQGRVFCVQTFSMFYPVGTFGKKTDRGCGPVGPRG